MVQIQTDRALEEIQTRFRLTEQEIDRAFQRARRRASAAGYDRALRQITRITGEGRQFWTKPNNRVYTSLRHTGEGKIWVGLNPERPRREYQEGEDGRYRSRTVVFNFPELPEQFDSEAIAAVMEQIFEAELEKAAIQAVSR